MDETLKRILNLNSSKGNDDKTLERELELKPKTVNNWKRGLSEGYMKMLPQLAKYFHVSVDYLLGLIDVPNGYAGTYDIELVPESEDERKMLNLYRAVKQKGGDTAAIQFIDLLQTLLLTNSEKDSITNKK